MALKPIATNEIRRPAELTRARDFLLDSSQTAMLVLYGDRYEGRTGLLWALKGSVDNRPFWPSLIRWDSREPTRFLDRGIAHAVARKLVGSAPATWRRYFSDLRDLGLIEDVSFDKVTNHSAIKHCTHNLQKYFNGVRGQCLLDESLPPKLIPGLADLTSTHWGFVLTELFDTNDVICVLVDDVDFRLGSPQSNVMHWFAEGTSFSTPIKLAISVSAESLTQFSTCFNSLIRRRKIPIDALRIDPIKIDRSSPRSIRQAPFPPVIPGVVSPERAKSLSGDELFEIVAKHDYYSQVHAAQIMVNGWLDVLAAGLVWVFGKVSDHDLIQVADHVQVKTSDLRASFEANYFLHNIRGSWEFIDGWREYLVVRRQGSDLVDSVEDLFCVLALGQFRDSMKESSPFPVLQGRGESFLSPEITKIFSRFINAIRSFAQSGRRKRKYKSFEHAAAIFKILEELGHSRSSMWIPLASELFDQTQSLEMLDFALSAIEAGTGTLTQEEKNAVLIAASNSLRWNDVTLGRNVIRVLAKRKALAWSGDEALKLVQIRAELLRSGQPYDLTEFTSQLMSHCANASEVVIRSIREILQNNGVPESEINSIDSIRSKFGPLPGSAPKLAKKPSRPPQIGIITALPKELTAMRAMLMRPKRPTLKRSGGMKEYYVGSIPDRNGAEHQVALGLAGAGNNHAAARATNLLRDFPSVRIILMVGIAGGIPYPEKPEHHVRLGDIVVSGEGGIIQYDMVKDTDGELEYRSPSRPPSAEFLEAAKFMESEMIGGADPISIHAKRAIKKLGWRRPPAKSDVLFSGEDPTLKIAHPKDNSRIAGKPKIFLSPIASANVLLKNPRRREEIRDRFGVRAVEMESSGIADSTWDLDTHYLAIRGICDYCDTKKNDDWQRYAALIAAAYARALLGSMAAL